MGPNFHLSRSSQQRCSVGKGVLRNSVKFKGKHLCQSLFFNKVAGLRPATSLNRDSSTSLSILQNCPQNTTSGYFCLLMVRFQLQIRIKNQVEPFRREASSWMFYWVLDTTLSFTIHPSTKSLRQDWCF